MATAFERWRERMQHANRWWESNGLVPEGRHKDWGNVLDWIGFYRGDSQWEGRQSWGELPREDLLTTNISFSVTNTMVSSLSYRYPEFVVTPKTEEAIRGARIMRIVLQYYLQELRMKRQVDRALLDALQLPAGFVRHGFTPRIEKFEQDGKLIETYHHAQPDLPWIRRVPIWGIRIDPLAETWDPDGDARWCAFLYYLSKEQIRETESMVLAKDLTTVKLAKTPENTFQQWQPGGEIRSSPDFLEAVELWDVYDRVERRWMTVAPSSDSWIREPRPWPIQWEHLPYSYLGFNEQPDSQVPIPFPRIYWDQQVMINKSDTIAGELVKRLRRIIAYDKSALVEGEDRTLEQLGLAEFLPVRGNPGNFLKEIQIGGLPQELLLYRQTQIDLIREIVGQSQLERAQRINVETAAEADAVRQASAVQGSRQGEKFEVFWEDIGRTFAQALRHVLPEETLVRVVGETDAQVADELGDFLSVSREDLEGEFRYSVRVGSSRPRDASSEFAKHLQIFQLFQADGSIRRDEMVRRLLESAGMDSERLLLSPEELQQLAASFEQQGLVGGPPARQGSVPAGSAQGQGPAADAGLLRALQSPRGSSAAGGA